MADSIISPTEHKAPGGLPRNLMVFGLLGVFAIGSAVYLYQAPDTPAASDVSAIASANAASPDAMKAMPKGNPETVDTLADGQRDGELKRKRKVAADAIDRAASEAAAAASAASAAQTSGGGSGQPVVPTFGGQGQSPAVAVSAGAAQPRTGSGIDPGEVERERARRESPSVVFDGGQADGDDQGDVLGAIRKSRAQIQRAIGQTGESEADGVLAATNAAMAAIQKASGGQGQQGSPSAGKSSDEAFLSRMAQTQRASPVTEIVPPAGRFVLEQGRVIPAVTVRAITSDAPGVLTARSTTDVYDRNGNMLIPKGTEFVGQYNSAVAFGQSRMIGGFKRMVLPNGYSMDLPAANISDAMGTAGIEGDVDRHFFRTFGAALLLGVLADRVAQASKVPVGALSGGQLSATGQVFVDTAKTELERNKSIAPTITVPAATKVNIEVVADMVFPGSYRQWAK